MTKNFSYVTTRTCRRFYKRHYTLGFPIDTTLLNELEQFGIMEVMEFSKYSATAYDTFKIKFDEQVDISGLINGKELQVTLSKEQPSLLALFEETLDKYAINI